MLLFIDSTIEHLEEAINFWNTKYQDIYSILTTNPTEFQNGTAWQNVTNVLHILEGVGASLLILFFLYGYLKMSVDYRDFTRNPKSMIMPLIRLGIAEFFVTHTTDILLKIIEIVQAIISDIPTVSLSAAQSVPPEIRTALEDASWWSKLGAWTTSLIGQWIVFALVIVILVVIYGRFFKIFMLTAIAPIPLAGFSSEATSSLGRNFLKSYICELLRGAVMLVACSIFSTFIASGSLSNIIVESDTAGWMVTGYVLDIITQLLLLVITVKGSDRLVKEIFGLGG